MIEGYDKSDIAMMKRDAKKKEEYELGHIKEMAIAEGRAEGKAEGRAEGIAEGELRKLESNIKTMFNNGATIEMISKLLSLDISYVNEVLNK